MDVLKDKVAVIAGETSEIAGAVARRFVQEGSFVFMIGQQRQLDQSLKAIFENIIRVVGDPSDPSDIDRLYETAKSWKGTLDILLVTPPAGDHVSFATITEAMFLMVQMALPMLSDGASIILNTSSMYRNESSQVAVESPARTALRSFARTWVKELKARRIRVNAVNSGPRSTPNWLNDSHADKSAKELIPEIISNRAPFRTPKQYQEEQVAKAVAFLASEESHHISGKEFFLSGGSMSNGVPLGSLGTPDEIAGAVVLLASDESITGTELFVGAGFAML